MRALPQPSAGGSQYNTAICICKQLINLYSEGDFIKGKFLGTAEDEHICLCDICKCQVYSSDEVYFIDGFIVCLDCFDDFSKHYFMDNRHYAGKLLRRGNNGAFKACR